MEIPLQSNVCTEHAKISPEVGLSVLICFSIRSVNMFFFRLLVKEWLLRANCKRYTAIVSAFERNILMLDAGEFRVFDHEMIITEWPQRAICKRYTATVS